MSKNNKQDSHRCENCSAEYRLYAPGHCCRRHRRYCPECSVKEHMDEMEHGLALAAKARFELPSVRVKVR